MMLKGSKWKYWVRRSHRFLGVFLGIQFLLWTLGGLYFSWTNIDDIHGDFQRNPPPALALGADCVSPSVVVNNLKQTAIVDSIDKIQLAMVLDTPYYQVVFWQNNRKKVALLAAQTGQIRQPLSAKEAETVARAAFKGAATVVGVQYLVQADGHHEYREKPLPAYAVSFEHPSRTVVYVSTEWGTVQSFRNQKWRVFDFLWMLHTMDFQGRDNINNWVLRGASILGLLTILSGFLLFFITMRRRKLT